ncbi:MAG: hypothetical protein BHW58_07810 [Azospirillum sp. 51_20]|nr:MAG: hypothetical protein BHW58_07810 [Azospirillum sp. 51_20]
MFFANRLKSERTIAALTQHRTARIVTAPSSPKVAKQPLAANCASPRPVSGYMLSLAAPPLRILDKTCVIIFK